MSSRSLNKVMLIGNLTRDPELRYTPNGAAVCTIGLATNRAWTTESGEKKEDVEFHRVVAWNKLAELCSQLLTKGRKIYVEGRLRTNSWQATDGSQKSTTEIVIEDMIILDSRRSGTGGEEGEGGGYRPASLAGGHAPANNPPAAAKTAVAQPKVSTDDNAQVASKPTEEENVNPDDIPF